jgi:hypothetical protein
MPDAPTDLLAEFEERMITLCEEMLAANIQLERIQATAEMAPGAARTRFAQKLLEAWREDWEMRELGKK